MSLYYDEAMLRKNLIKPEKTYDVLVCGGGPSGVAAALSAARVGASVALIEARSQLGGTMTGSFFMPVNWLYVNQNYDDRGGIQRLFGERIAAMGKDACTHGRHSSFNLIDGGNLDCHPDYVRLMLYDWFDEWGIDYLLNAAVFDVVKEGNATTGVVAYTKEALITLKAKIIIDATGDGDVALKAGCNMISGREEDGKHMPMMLAFLLGNTNPQEAFSFWYDKDTQEMTIRGMLKQLRETGKYKLASWYTLDSTTLPGVLSVNGGGSEDLNLDGGKVADLTVMEKLGVRLAVDFVRMAREEKLPGLQDCVLLRTSSFASIRDTRFVEGEYTLTMEDVLQKKAFPDTIALKYSNSDPVGIDIDSRIPDKKLPVPYRCLVPKQVDNLLVAGRNSSFTFMGFSYGRSMGDIMDLGQAAGVAAAICAQQNVHPRNIDVQKLQTVLRGFGVQI